jgi:uncharacterized membrane protein YkoI
MKVPLWTVVATLVVTAQSDQLKVDSGTPLQFYNHRSTVKLQYRQKLRRLTEIDADKAKEIALRECRAKTVHSETLTHRGQLLYYDIVTDRCRIEINALDGKVISKQTPKRPHRQGERG